MSFSGPSSQFMFLETVSVRVLWCSTVGIWYSGDLTFSSVFAAMLKKFSASTALNSTKLKLSSDLLAGVCFSSLTLFFPVYFSVSEIIDFLSIPKALSISKGSPDFLACIMSHCSFSASLAFPEKCLQTWSQFFEKYSLWSSLVFSSRWGSGILTVFTHTTPDFWVKDTSLFPNPKATPAFLGSHLGTCSELCFCSVTESLVVLTTLPFSFTPVSYMFLISMSPASLSKEITP
mmetsp:Transcript_5044/g.7615  ORF Transcript_5044/g.7615 Transcript_5044/m.7615 type:complete len:233 (-) Transcript_5044:875-1573(-)